MTKTIRCKSQHGVTYTWRIGQNKDGKWRSLSVGKPSNKMPMDFAPFRIMDAVLNKNIVFDTEAQAEAFVRAQ